MLSYVIPDISFMQISAAVHYSAYFGLGILYCFYKGRVDAILLPYFLIFRRCLCADLLPMLFRR